MRRRSVNILRRTCWRNGDNFFATSRCRTSASAISRFTRLLSCPSGRWSRHLFLFLFWLFFFPAENSSLLWFFRRSGGRGLSLCFRCGFHLKNKLRRHIVVQLDGNLLLAGIFDRVLKNNFVPINLCTDFVFQAVDDVLRCHRSKCFSSLASLESKNKARFANTPRQFFGLAQFPRLALGPLLLKRIKLTQSGRRDFVRHPARQQVIACITATHLDHVRLGAEPGNIFRQDELS